MNVSIPHRYDPNLSASYVQTATENLFQFLIGTIQTTRPQVLTWEGIAVSIPHRYDPNETTTDIEAANMTEFQFLIGTIQTREALFAST